jgi:DNA-binding response OmpR family regulator
LEAHTMTIFEPGETAPRMLIADDDPSIVKLMAYRCSQMGFEVETASDGTQAFERIRQDRYLDYRRPDA